ncbi:hypothetical protein GCM10011416_20600 [Polaribacter pacificus]|uniref:Aminoglycoside N(3)-acetyltransferase n=1 Tax=Polaribacter pacificus TaxID=1775173 RepID=A0A917ME75_9FLAO|nr:AAC(3) family N-acetyltransferase [Polaribacter pacificus]GGH01699.1 hypothetical protein GCM10011416_20600 [Polaribacter pacificus]
MSIIIKESIKNDLINLGIKEGDVLYLTIDTLNVGFFNKNRSTTLNTWLEIFFEILGEKGSIILSAYTETFWSFNKKKDLIFTRCSKTSNGAFSNFLIKNKKAVRSRHPTNSVIGIGGDIENILINHHEHSKAYSVFKELISRKAKFLMIGTLDNKNTPQAMHYCQELLGHNDHFFGKGFIQTYYYDINNVLKLFTLKDSGGCSRGGYKLYGPLILNKAIEFGYVGNAFSAIMDGEYSKNVILKELKNNKNLIQCDNKYCISCYGSFYKNGFKVIPFYIRKIIEQIKKILNKKYGMSNRSY